MSNQSIFSNYWKVNQNEPYSTSFHIPENTSLSIEQDTIAVGSNYLTENLKIYQLSADSLIHLASISLPDIQSLKFLKPISSPPYDFKFLLTGHSNGIVHLSAIPLNDNTVFENAEIIKRLNHKKHIKNSSSKPFYNNNNILSTTISTIELTNSSWNSTPLNSLVSIYDNHLFLWDTSRSRAPLSMIQTIGISNVSLNYKIDSLTAIVGDFGLSLLDLRTGKNNFKTSLYLPLNSSSSSLPLKFSSNNFKGFSMVQWCESNENYLATAQNDIVYIWDIRKSEPLTKLTEFTDSITKIKWKGDNLWTGDNDGYLINWNLKNLQNLQNKNCVVANNSDIANLWNNNNNNNNNINTEEISCGNSTKISNFKIIDMDLSSDFNENKIICLDDSYLSTHELKRPKMQPQIVEKVSINYNKTNDLIETNYKPVKLDLNSKRIVSNGTLTSAESGSTLQLFDSSNGSKKINDNSIIEPSSPITETGFETGESKRNKDRLNFFNKEIDEMINQINKTKINDIDYL